MIAQAMKIARAVYAYDTIRDVDLDTVLTGNLKSAGDFLTPTAEATSSRVFNHHRHRKMHRSGVG